MSSGHWLYYILYVNSDVAVFCGELFSGSITHNLITFCTDLVLMEVSSNAQWLWISFPSLFCNLCLLVLIESSLVYLLKVYCHRCVYSYVSATDFVPIFVEYILGISRFVENLRSHLSVYININKMCQSFTIKWYNNTTCSTTIMCRL